MNADIINECLLRHDYEIIILMNSYNHEQYIAQAIDSVIAQDGLDNALVLVYDDCSTDKSAEIAKRYAETYPKLITAVLFKENNYSRGINIFSELLYPILNTKYIALCECDDYWLGTDRLIKQIRYLDKNQRCNCVVGNCYCINEYNAVFIHPPFTPQHTHKYDIQNYRYGNRLPGQTASKVYRKAIYDDLDPRCLVEFNKLTGSGDVKLDALCVLSGYIYHLSDFVSVYRKITTKGSSWSARTANINLSFSNARFLFELEGFAKKWFNLNLLIEPHVAKQLLNSVLAYRKQRTNQNKQIIEDIIGLLKTRRCTFGRLAFKSVQIVLHRLLQKIGIIEPKINYDLSRKEIELVTGQILN